MSRLEGKVAVVTGASRGIGRAIALELARAGADIVATARTESPRGDLPGTIHQTAEDVRGMGRRALPYRADLTQAKDIDALAATTLETFGKVDILVNNAAYTSKAIFASFWDMTPESWGRQMALNLNAPFLLCKAFAPAMREQGGGMIVNITSGAAHTDSGAMPGEGGEGPAYPASKAALDRLTLALAKELRPHGIAIIGVDPGFTLTETAEMLAETRGYVVADANPMAFPASTVAYLAACPNPMWYTGKIIVSAEFVQEHLLAQGSESQGSPR